MKALDVNQRKCLTKDEVEKDSMFKDYDENNCKYECYVRMASQSCNCTPWDFLMKDITHPECDVFGRTCFYEMIKRMENAKNSDICVHCITACDAIEYHANVEVVFRPIAPRDQFLVLNPIIKEYLSLEKYITDKRLLKILKTSLSQSTMNTFKARYSDMIVITFRFRNPNIDYIDLRYSLMDNGGTFGIFAQVTGTNLMGLLSFIVFLVKTFLNCRN